MIGVAEAQRWLRARLLEGLYEGEASAAVLELRVPRPGGRPEPEEWGSVILELARLTRGKFVASRVVAVPQGRFRRTVRLYRLTETGVDVVARRALSILREAPCSH